MKPARTEVGRRARTELLHEWALRWEAEAAAYVTERSGDVLHTSNEAGRDAAQATQNAGMV